MEGLTLKFKIMTTITFFSKWIRIEGKELKGVDLGMLLLFLAYVLMLIFAALATIDVPKMQVFFQ